MYRLSKEFRFEASHQLEFHDGKCARLHGHGYIFSLEVMGGLIPEGPQQNMVMDYYHLSKAGKAIVEQLDHEHLNEILKTNMPTAEFISRWIFDQVKKTISILHAVEVSETDSSNCRYSPEESRVLELGRMKVQEIKKRLSENIKQAGEDDCWPFTGSRDTEGYGYCSYVVAGTNKAHRLILWLDGADIDGKPVLHSCDNPPCCNPRHLRVGTHAENESDKDLRGRRPLGEDAGPSKLTNEQVRDIWEDSKNYPSQKESFVRSKAAHLGVSKGTIRGIISGWSWNKITGLPRKYKGKKR